MPGWHEPYGIGTVLNGQNCRPTDVAAHFALVPEPASRAMMIGGFGLVGGAMRRRVRPTSVRFAA